MVLGRRPPGGDEDAGKRKSIERRHDAMRAWGAVGSAFGSLFAAITLAFGVYQFNIAQDRWQKEVAIRAISEGNSDQPFISRHCLGAASELDITQLKAVHERRPVKLLDEQVDVVRRCLADLNDDQLNNNYIHKVVETASARLLSGVRLS